MAAKRTWQALLLPAGAAHATGRYQAVTMAEGPHKVSDLMAAATKAGQKFYSFEFFPPKTDIGTENL
jgi:hypothetical protein